MTSDKFFMAESERTRQPDGSRKSSRLDANDINESECRKTAGLDSGDRVHVFVPDDCPDISGAAARALLSLLAKVRQSAESEESFGS
ncbi:hypothetical protein [Actinoplanes sp. L3-i22]|uniref:hypothetical protein n=1 Tax=Actinoplanes sp. L3-i22 TaxID=2836373 RepID=UPI001C8500FF|nr:hypothetical protein [Actinoplanes sp. L3-i22]